MTTERSVPLPVRRNPLLGPEHTPESDTLIDRRRLARTNLNVRPGLVNTSNATKSENLGNFDYVHLRVPLPKDLTGSGVFWPTASIPTPDAYFLMRRCRDGFLSATGMFKAAFPWASRAEEEAERHHLKTLPGADHQEVAGNIWVPPEFGLELAAEYSITAWIEALLANGRVQIASPSLSKVVTQPPAFHMPPKSSAAANAANTSRKQRDVRSASPTKMAPPTPAIARPKKTPRKPRARKAAAPAAPEATPSVADSVADSEDIDNGDEDANASSAAAPVVDNDDEDEEEPLGSNNVRVSVQEEVRDDGETQTTHTTVKVELPASSPDLELPSNTEGVVEMAKEIIENVKDMQEGKTTGSAAKLAPSQGARSLKRSRDAYEEDRDEKGPEELVEEEGGAGGAEEREERPAKRTRLMVPAEEYRKEKVQKRALMGLSGALAFGLIIPTIASFWA